MIKIIRLSAGYDVIGDLSDVHSGAYTINEPMVFDINYKGGMAQIMLDTLYPVTLIKNNALVVADKDIIYTMDPSDMFIEYYQNFVEGLRDKLTEQNIDKTVEMINQELMLNILESMDENERPMH